MLPLSCVWLSACRRVLGCVWLSACRRVLGCVWLSAFWALTDWNEAQLVGYITPKTLERRFPDVYRGISDAEDD